MDFRKIALRIAFSKDLLRKLPPDILEEWGATGAPIEEGQSSAIFRTSQGRIVAFTASGYAAEVAKASVGKTVLPEVYRSEVVKIGKDEISAVEMEELRPLSRSERDNLSNVWIARSEPETRSDWTDADRKMETISDDLFSRMEKEGVKHHDMVPSNVAWGSDGRLKLLDIDSIEFV